MKKDQANKMNVERVYRQPPLAWEPGLNGSGVDLQLVWEWAWCSCVSCASMLWSWSRVEVEGVEWRWKGSEVARGGWRRGREVIPWQKGCSTKVHSSLPLLLATWDADWATKMCHCPNCGPQGKELNFRTWDGHQAKAARQKSHQQYSNNLSLSSVTEPNHADTCTSESALEAPISDFESSGYSHCFTSDGSSNPFEPWPQDHQLEELDSSGVTDCYELMHLETSDIKEDESGSDGLPGDDPLFDDFYQYTIPGPSTSAIPINVPLMYQNHDPCEPDENNPNPFCITLPPLAPLTPWCTPWQQFEYFIWSQYGFILSIMSPSGWLELFYLQSDGFSLLETLVWLKT